MKIPITHLTLLLLMLSGLVSAQETPDNIKKINHVNMLLPVIYDTLENRNIQHTLEGYNGCYEWKTSQPPVLRVTGINDEKNPQCQSKAIVSLATQKPFNNIVWITAHDQETRDILKCESRVTNVHSIAIMTKLRTIDVGDLEELHIIGYDKEGNVFSSLQGLRFSWSIDQRDDHLEMVMLKDTSMRSTEIRRKLEMSNYHSDIMVFKGLKTGQARVTVKLNEKGYDNVQASVIIYVVEHFNLFPSHEVYLLPFSTLQLDLALIKHDFTHEKVKLPNTNYLWKSDQAHIGDISSHGLLTLKDKTGTVRVSVNDTRTADNSVDNLVHVVFPSTIDLQIKEYTNNSVWYKTGLERYKYTGEEDFFENNWNLVKGREYYIRAVVYDDRRNNIIVANNAKINVEVDPNLFDVIERRNGEVRVRAKTIVESKKIAANLDSVVSNLGTYRPEADGKKIRVDKTFIISSQVTLLKPSAFIHLPFYRAGGQSIQQPFKLQALGGSKHYEWISLDLNTAVVSQEGIILPKNVGVTTIEVRDKRNMHNVDTIRVEITEVGLFSFLEKLKELLVNNTGEANYYLTSQNGHRYSNCSALPVEVFLEHPSMLTASPLNLSYNQYIDFLSEQYNRSSLYTQALEPFSQRDYLSIQRYKTLIDDERLDSAVVEGLLRNYRNFGFCGKIGFTGIYKGETTARGSLRDLNVTSYHEELRIRIYEPMRTSSPEIVSQGKAVPLEIILAYGSSFLWEVEEGPYQWEDSRRLNVELENTPKGQANSLVRTLDHSPRQILRSKKIFSVTCDYLPHGAAAKDVEHTLTLKAGNTPDSKLLDPVSLSLTIKVSCEIPTSLQIYIWKIDEPQLNINSVTSLISEVFTLKNNEDHTFQIWVFDRLARPFYNFSSLDVQWEINRQDVGKLVPYTPPQSMNNLVVDQYARLHLKEFEGELLLTASANHYQNHPHTHSFPKIHDTIAIKILNDIELEPKYSLLILDVRNKLKLNILRGSKEFAVRTNDSSVIEIDYDRSTQVVTVKPLKLGYARVEVEDLKLVHSRKSYSDIVVAMPQRVSLTTDTNLLQENNVTFMDVVVYDYNDKKFSDHQLQYLDLELKLDSDSEFLKNHALKISPSKLPGKFEVQGKLTGEYKLVASSLKYGLKSSDRQDSLNFRLFSNQVDLHVFQKLEARPPRVVIGPGCVTSIAIVGGPSEKSKMQNNVELTLTPTGVRFITTSQEDTNLIMIKGLEEGDTEIHFQMKYRYKSTDVIADLVVPVKVATITAVDILGMQDRKIHVGAQCRLIAVTRSNNDIFTPALCPMKYYWVSKNDHVLQIHGTQGEFAGAIDGGKQLSIMGKEKMSFTDYHLGVNATALNPGVAEVELKIVFDYPKRKDAHTQTRTMKIQVVDILSTNVPTYISQPDYHPSVLLIPPNVEYVLHPNRDRSRLRFSMYSNAERCEISGVSLSSEGRLTTSNEKGKVTVLVEDNVNSASDLMMVNVLITDIYSIFIENSYKVLSLPVDADANLQVHLQDNIGRSFPSPSELNNLKLGIRVTNQHAIDGNLVERNSIVKIRAKSAGVSLVMVYLEDAPEIYDIFMVMVGSMISLGHSASVHVGGVLEFNIKSNIKSGHWSAEDSSMIDIQPKTGRAIALKEGRTNIKYSDTIEHVTKVSIFKINRIQMDSNIPSITNVKQIDREGAYKFPFRFYNDEREIKDLFTPGQNVNHNLKFECVAKPESWFTANVEKDNVCTVRFKSYVNQDTFPTHMTIEATVSSIDPSVKFRHTEQSNVDIVWAFNLDTNQKKKTQLSKSQPTTVIKIRTPTALDVYADSDLYSRWISQDFDPYRNLMTINFTVPNDPLFINRYTETGLTVENPASHQKEHFEIIYDPEGSRMTGLISNGLNFTLTDYLVIIVLLFVFGILIYIMNSYKDPRVGQGRTPGGAYSRPEGAYTNYNYPSSSPNRARSYPMAGASGLNDSDKNYSYYRPT